VSDGARGGTSDGAQPVGSRTYYGTPVVAPPVWKPSIALYFFTGGLAGASAGLGLAARLAGRPELARRCALAAISGAAASPALLIEDLGRPERFHHMLRMFKVTSPMSVGTWILTAFGGASGVVALSELTGRFRPAGRACQWASAALGMPLATYTAALVANTSMPVWRRGRFHLPFLFAASSAGAAGSLAAIATPARESAPAAALAAGGAVASAGVTWLMERHLGEDAEPYRSGSASRFARAAAPLGLAGAAALVAGRRNRLATVAGGALVLASSLAERFAVLRAGADSARHTLR
jgi:DMSO reductase anchor subunit